MLSARGETSDKYPGTRQHIRKGLREDSRWRIRTLRLDDPAGYLEGFRTEGCATCLAGSASSGFFKAGDSDARRCVPAMIMLSVRVRDLESTAPKQRPGYIRASESVVSGVVRLIASQYTRYYIPQH